jgi:hypothetical protein
MKKELTQERLKYLFDYDHKTGIFTRKVRTCNSVNIGDIAGYDHLGYRMICIDRKEIFSHRLAWLYVYGYMPKNFIDHINGIKSDNRIENLREANRCENYQNQKVVQKRNKSSKFLGTSFNKHANKFTAQIQIYGKKTHLGCFETAIEAHNAYIEAKRKYHPFNTL